MGAKTLLWLILIVKAALRGVWMRVSGGGLVATGPAGKDAPVSPARDVDGPGVVWRNGYAGQEKVG
jgi:hypothetical protein